MNRTLILFVCVLLGTDAQSAEEPIETILKNLKPGSAVLLPKARIQDAKGNVIQTPIRHRDYCNKMVYAPERKTALYAGGSHQTWRSNDVWEFDLASNTWTRLFAPDGGNHAHIKSTLYNVIRREIRDPKYKMTEKQKTDFEQSQKWWKENVVLKEGHITTRNGGPVMPAHTWDGVTYDPLARRLIWASGAGPGGRIPHYHARLMEIPVKEVAKKLDPDYSNAWMFDPKAKMWRQQKSKGEKPRLAGMGATLHYIPELKKSIYYVAATNVSPGDYGMWTYDAVENQWARLKPNNGEKISTLVHRMDQAPLAEQQVAYSSKHGKLVAVHKTKTFVYDVKKNEWSKVAEDERIYGHDARSVFAYDESADAFLLIYPRGRTPLASFSLATNKWTVLKPAGTPVPTRRYRNYMGYYDPIHQVTVLADGTDRVWVYRHQK